MQFSEISGTSSQSVAHKQSADVQNGRIRALRVFRAARGLLHSVVEVPLDDNEFVNVMIS